MFQDPNEGSARFQSALWPGFGRPCSAHTHRRPDWLELLPVFLSGVRQVLEDLLLPRRPEVDDTPFLEISSRMLACTSTSDRRTRQESQEQVLSLSWCVSLTKLIKLRRLSELHRVPFGQGNTHLSSSISTERCVVRKIK